MCLKPLTRSLKSVIHWEVSVQIISCFSVGCVKQIGLSPLTWLENVLSYVVCDGLVNK